MDGFPDQWIAFQTHQKLLPQQLSANIFLLQFLDFPAVTGQQYSTQTCDVGLIQTRMCMMPVVAKNYSELQHC